MSAMPLEQEIEYPTSDGQPMAETSLHRKVIFDLIEGLENRYTDVPDVWVDGNLFLCYERGNPSACRAPWPEEEAAARKAAERRAAREAQARHTAEEQVRALQAELDRLRQDRKG